MMHDFVFKPFQEMQPEDYARVGFKSGLEIHQQLLTSKKLFCRCPAGRYNEKYDAEILRHMRPTLSELGEYDGTALMEFKTRKEILYRIHRETVCTYEMDDTPPFEIDDEALDIALGIGMLYGCIMVDEIHIARKQYLDGSIPTGFQRTAIVGLDGKIPFKDRHIRVVQLSIEEDACREVSDVGHLRVYLTDRLGMPLIETVTGPDMRTPHEVAEVAQLCRQLVRSTGQVRTGIGAAREDVNVSVDGGTRVEIKGVPRIAMIPILTHNEAMRQWNLLKLRDELHRRGITQDSFQARFEDVTKLLRKTRYQPVQSALASGMVAYCVLLRGFKGLLHWQTQSSTYFSKEISDRLRVVACLTTLPNMVHSESPGDTLSSSEWQSLGKTLGATSDDTIVLVWGAEQDATTGAKEVVIRAKEATVGIPSETRQALRDGTNGFERILPGPNRMYPDTDLPPKRIEEARLTGIKQTLPEPVWDRQRRYREMGLPEDVIVPLSVSRLAQTFDVLVQEWHIHPTLAAVALVQFTKRLKAFHTPGSLTNDELRQIFRAHRDGILTKDAILYAMADVVRNGKFSSARYQPTCSTEELRAEVRKALGEVEKQKLIHPGKLKEVVTGVVMKTLRGRVDGAVVVREVAAMLQEHSR